MVRKKTDPFWEYVEERPNERWKCKFCGSEYSGHASRIKAHFGQVKNRGIEVCRAVDPYVKVKALRALHLEATGKGQTSLGKTLVEETAQNMDNRIEAESIENFHPLSDFHLPQGGNQSVHNPREDPPVPMPLLLSAEIQDCEVEFDTLFPGFDSDGLLSNADITNVQQAFLQEDVAGGTAGETLTEDCPSQNPHQSAMDMLQQSGSESIDDKLYSLKRKLEELDSLKEKEEEELCHLRKKVKAIKYAYKSINDNRRDGKVSSFHQEDIAGGTAGETSIENYLQQNFHQSGMDILQQCGSRSVDEKLYYLKIILEELNSQKEEKEEELHHFSKKVKTIENAHKSIKEDQKDGKVSSIQQGNQLEEWIAEVEVLKNPGAKSLSSSVHNTKRAPFLTTETIGRQNEISKIWNYIITNDVLRVGIYGMGGVGKTRVMMQIYNKLLENEAFDNVFWATIPQDCTIYELQGLIGNAVHLDEISNEKNEKIRASMLHRFLTTEKKTVLILDSLWQHLDFDDVGIPTRFYGFKLVISSRSLDACRMMLCQAEIKIQCLSDCYWWRIFWDRLGSSVVLPTKVREIATQIISTYGGLPLYINMIATRMRGIGNLHEWKDMMEKMKDPNARVKELKNEVIDHLKLSYEFLADEQLQKCFIYCALYIGSRKYRRQREMRVSN